MTESTGAESVILVFFLLINTEQLDRQAEERGVATACGFSLSAVYELAKSLELSSISSGRWIQTLQWGHSCLSCSPSQEFFLQIFTRIGELLTKQTHVRVLASPKDCHDEKKISPILLF